MTFDLTGRTVVAVRSDGTILYLDLDGDWFLVIENDYDFTTSDRDVLSTASAGEDERIVKLLEAAVGTKLSSFRYTETGHLSVGIAGGVLRVGTSDYESWHFVGPNKERVVATPGGELAIWS